MINFMGNWPLIFIKADPMCSYWTILKNENMSKYIHSTITELSNSSLLLVGETKRKY